MLRTRTREYRYYILEHNSREKVTGWKKSKGKLPLPLNIYCLLMDAIEEYFQEFDLLTVPAPSFHTYDNYPIWEIAKRVAKDCGIRLEKLFPDHSGKKRMGWLSSIDKKVQEIELDPGLFVLVLDDVFTTGYTFRVTCEAILNRGSYPCCLALC